MSLAQQNFESSLRNADTTLGALTGPQRSQIRLGEESVERLREWLWGLEAIAASLREELATREDEPIDLG